MNLRRRAAFTTLYIVEIIANSWGVGVSEIFQKRGGVQNFSIKREGRVCKKKEAGGRYVTSTRVIFEK